MQLDCIQSIIAACKVTIAVITHRYGAQGRNECPSCVQLAIIKSSHACKGQRDESRTSCVSIHRLTLQVHARRHKAQHTRATNIYPAIIAAAK